MNKKAVSLMIAFHFLVVIAHPQVGINHLKTENLSNPIGIDARQPRFSWQLQSDKRNVTQTAYEIIVTADNRPIWKTGKVSTSQSIFVPYAGDALQSAKKYNWMVRVWDNEGKASAFSNQAVFQMALLDTSDWKAKWIGPGFVEDSIMRPSPLFRKEFNSGKKIKSATAFITAHGLYEAQLNGKRMGDAYLTPGWTSYNKRLQYQVYDVTDMVKQGKNAIAVTLGSGWYRGSLGWDKNFNIYGKDISLLFQLHIIYGDGSMETVVSDESWKSSTGAIRYSEIYNGETIDARLNKTGWNNIGYNDKAWSGVKLRNFSKSNLLATHNEPVKKHETFKPVRFFTTPKGEKVIDFGQNMVGWVMLNVKGKAGDTITLSHAEVIDKNGNFYTENLRNAKEQDTYILKGDDEEFFEPHFTWQGFRYVKVQGFTGEMKPENFTAVALYSDMEPTGSFTTSNPLINQLQHNIEWGQKGNFLDVPTDCPQRDERLGWTGDAQVFSRTASFLMGTDNFFSKWMKDVAADQFSDGSVPNVIPNVLGKGGGSAGWSDVATIVPWNMYLAYGDRAILQNQYPSMKAWVDFMQTNSKDNLWNTGFHFGDWLFYSRNDDNDGTSAITNKYLIAQCFYANSTQLLINAAKVLGKSDDVNRYTDLLAKIKDAFIKEYVTLNGATMSNTQTSYVLALNFDMLPENLRQQAVDRLVKNIHQYNNHLTTGFLGTPYLCHVLSRFGYTDIAYKLLLQDTYPSWLYPVKMGATTIWERWDGLKTDGTFETPTMNSFNHYAYGAIGDWMYRVTVGLDTESDENGVGYKKVSIKPHIGGGFTYAQASLETSYGKFASGWKIEKGQILLSAEIAPNTTATIYIPTKNIAPVTEGGKPLADDKTIQIAGTEKDYTILKVGSGKYQFETAWADKEK